jgi:hypothetical protein
MLATDDIADTSGASTGALGGSVPAHRGIFSREGEFWRIAYDDESFALRHSKGLAYLAQLLRLPGTEFHALDLVGRIVGAASDRDDSSIRSFLPHGDGALASAGIHVGGLRDAGEMLDKQTKAQHRRCLDELREELDEAERLGNIERAERTETEIDMLTAELSRAVGLGGRNRRAASASERARQTVTRTIRSAIERSGIITGSSASFSRGASRPGHLAHTIWILPFLSPGNSEHPVASILRAPQLRLQSNPRLRTPLGLMHCGLRQAYWNVEEARREWSGGRRNCGSSERAAEQTFSGNGAERRAWRRENPAGAGVPHQGITTRFRMLRRPMLRARGTTSADAVR